jgi:hypothetical protein
MFFSFYCRKCIAKPRETNPNANRYSYRRMHWWLCTWKCAPQGLQKVQVSYSSPAVQISTITCANENLSHPHDGAATGNRELNRTLRLN